MNTSKRISLLIVLVLIGVNAVMWYSVIREERSGILTVAFLDVGQGDAIFIDSPSGRQVLIDGGSDQKVLRELAHIMPFYDRSIDVVIATHPDADHIGGLLEVLKRFNVTHVFRPGVANDTPATESLLQLISEGDVQEHLARRGNVIELGNEARIEILFPDRDVSELEPNNASIIARIVYGKHSFLLTGDSSKEIEEYFVTLDGDALQSTVLKAGHHGSKTSSSELFVGFIDPEYVVYSRGCKNRYGHPHQEVKEVYDQFEIKTLDTCEEGTIEFQTDGTNFLSIN